MVWLQVEPKRWHPSRLSVKSVLLKLLATLRTRIKQKPAAAFPPLAMVSGKDASGRGKDPKPPAQSRGALTAWMHLCHTAASPDVRPETQTRPDPTRGKAPAPTLTGPARALPVAQSRRAAPRFRGAMVAAGKLQAASAEQKDTNGRRCTHGKGSLALRPGAGHVRLQDAPRAAGLSLGACAELRRLRRTAAHAQSPSKKKAFALSGASGSVGNLA